MSLLTCPRPNPTLTRSRRPGPGRPQGEIRRAMQAAAQRLHADHGAFPWRELACAAQVGFGVARQTTKTMVRYGDLQTVGEARVNF